MFQVKTNKQKSNINVHFSSLLCSCVYKWFNTVHSDLHWSVWLGPLTHQTKTEQLFFEADEADAELRPLGQYSIRGKKKRKLFCTHSFKMYQASHEKQFITRGCNSSPPPKKTKQKPHHSVCAFTMIHIFCLWDMKVKCGYEQKMQVGHNYRHSWIISEK